MKPAMTIRPRWMFLIGALVCVAYVGIQMAYSYLSTKHDADRIRHIVASEELILKLNSELRELSRSARNLRLPDATTRSFFLPQVELVDVQGAVSTSGSPVGLEAVKSSWATGAQQTVDREQLQIWQPLLDDIAYFTHAKFYFIRGSFGDATLNTFITDVGFKGQAKLTDGRCAGVTAKQKVRWEQIAETTAAHPSWRIAEWTVKDLKLTSRSQRLFVESLRRALPDESDLQRARESDHQRAVVQFYRGSGQVRPWRYFSPISANQRPGLSVVDIDRDGYDDLYVMVRRGKNQLLRNRGDGTFEEVASDWGLDIEHFSSCGIFADFDNDGDADLMLGRSIEPSMYLENKGSRFVQRQFPSENNPLPSLVASMSAADYNGDGLLDVYFSTYRPAVLESLISAESESEVGDAQRWPDEFLSAADAREVKRRRAKENRGPDHFGQILNQVGPPNVLLVNRGNGHFEVAPESHQLALWRNTLQATWADFDEDGDPDVYVANDWAADNLLRNDGAQGFRDVTQQMGTTEFGFAMGVTWGDYDRDGRQDLYVSNMYSKAGRRIIAQIAELNPDYARSVVGNYLYRNSGEQFHLVSGLEPPAVTVAEAGWSWGGQFADFDNDGWLDLYVLSGYFSAPREFTSHVDL